ncbi:MAG: nucleoside diphosphate kinase regulator [Proteobacteria bacterium]|nr:nucleoside diphosphate kinase regulator [Pseudomonadota bacterium]HQR04113.1 nucleoside diphosphate kinase regulator [Rhodocyclaceae bacterium]
MKKQHAMIIPQMSELDLARLQRLLDQNDGDDRAYLDALRERLAQAQGVEPREIPADVVTMNSRVVYQDDDASMTLTLVYPEQADAAAGRVSVLSPIGSALLGAHTGQSVTCRFPDGREKMLKVRTIEFQPEASGQFSL